MAMAATVTVALVVQAATVALARKAVIATERAGMMVAAPATMAATVAMAGKAETMAGREGMTVAVTMAATVATHFVHMITYILDYKNIKCLVILKRYIIMFL